MVNVPQEVIPPPAPGPTDRRRLAVTVICLNALTAYTSTFPVFGTRIREFFSLSAEQYGSLMGMMSLGRIPALLSVGPLISLFGVRRIAEIGIIGSGASFLLLGIGGSVISFYFGLTALGLCTAVGAVAYPAFLFTLSPDFKRRIFSVMLVSTAAPAVLLPLLAGKLLRWSEAGGDEAFRWVLYVPFLIVGSVLVTGGLFMSLRTYATEESADSEQTGVSQLQTTSRIQLFELLNIRSLSVILLICLHGAADNTVYSFLPMFMENHFDHLPIAPAYAVAGHGLAYVVTRILLSVIPERIAQRAILCLSGPIGGLIVMASIWSGNATYVPLLYTLACFFFAAEYPTLISELSSRSIGNLGTVLAAGFLVSELATFTMMKMTGRLADQTDDYRVALSFAAGGFVAFGVIAFLTGLGRPRSESSRQYEVEHE